MSATLTAIMFLKVLLSVRRPQGVLAPYDRAPFAESLPDLRRKSYFNSRVRPPLLLQSGFSRNCQVCNDHKAYEHPTNVPVSRNQSRISVEKHTPTVANGHHACRDHDSQGIVKSATTTRHMSTLLTCPSCGITPRPLMKKLLQFSRMAATLAANKILKVF